MLITQTLVHSYVIIMHCLFLLSSPFQRVIEKDLESLGSNCTKLIVDITSLISCMRANWATERKSFGFWKMKIDSFVLVQMKIDFESSSPTYPTGMWPPLD